MRGRHAKGGAAVVSVLADAPSSGRDLDWQVDEATLLNTGVLDGVTRTAYTDGGFTSFPSGTYENLNITVTSFNGLTFVNGRSYHFKNCLITAAGDAVQRLVNATGAGEWEALLEDCTLTASWSPHDDDDATGGHVVAALGIRGHHFTSRRCQYLGLNDAIGVGAITGPTGVISELDYIAKFAFWRPDQNGRVEGTHNDGIAIDGGTGTIVRAPTIIGFNDPTIGDATLSQFTGGDGNLHGLEAGNDPEQWLNGACIFVRALTSPVNGTEIHRPRVTGGQVQVNISGSSGTITGVVLNDGKFGNDGTDDKGRYGKNVWFDSASYAAAAEVSGNTTIAGDPVTVASGRIQLT